MNQFIGVSAAGDRWKVQINRKSKVYYLGLYEDIRTAAEFADAGALITQAWSRGAPRLNFTTSRPVEEKDWDDLQRAMVLDLRHRHPEDERGFRRRDAAELFTPQVFLEDLDLMKDSMEVNANRMTAFAATARQTITRMASTLAEKEASLEFYRGKCASMENELAIFRDIKKKVESGAPPVVVMKQVAGPGFVAPPKEVITDGAPAVKRPLTEEEWLSISPEARKIVEGNDAPQVIKTNVAPVQPPAEQPVPVVPSYNVPIELDPDEEGYVAPDGEESTQKVESV